MCASNVAATSTYFIPSVFDYCKSATPCAKFRKQVRMQGSGSLPGNRILTYQGKVRSLGSCSTAFGASGKCLTPYISVAADPRFYRMGDIIQMPSMKGRVISLPNGKTMIHPGYFIVQDTGGAIKGRNRFDFFTGIMGMSNRKNAFGTRASADMQLVDKRDCSDHKFFSVVRRGSSSYENSLAMIEDAVQNSSSSRNVASGNSKGVR